MKNFTKTLDLYSQGSMLKQASKQASKQARKKGGCYLLVTSLTESEVASII